MDDQHSQSKIKGVVPAAKGLRRLTWPQVELLDQCVNDVCEAGFGSVVMTIERGKPLFVYPKPRLRLQPGRGD
jgi:UDP:flavonoid glycosyltransferase YjiC (YdhE family)